MITLRYLHRKTPTIRNLFSSESHLIFRGLINADINLHTYGKSEIPVNIYFIQETKTHNTQRILPSKTRKSSRQNNILPHF